MAQMDGALAVLDLHGRAARRAERRLNSMRSAWLVLFAIVFAIALWSGFLALQYGWETGQWGVEYQDKLLTFILIPVQSLLPWVQVVMRPIYRPTPRQLTTTAAALRDSAAHSADNIPVAADILSVLDGISAPALPATFGSFRRPNGELRSDDLVASICLLLAGLCLTGIFIAARLTAPRSLSWPPAVTFGGIALGVALYLGAIAFAAEAHRLRRGVRVQADDMGLRWEAVFPRRREVHLPWDAIRATFVISHTRGLDRHLACVVDGGDAVLAFGLSSNTPAAEVADANRLVKIVLARTGLALLDQTKLAENLCARRYSSQYRAAYETLTQPSPAGLSLAPLLPRPFTAKRIKGAFVVLLLPLLLIPGCVLTGIGLQHYQGQMYGALLAAARTHAPLYHDALTAADVDWQAHGPTSGDSNSYSFADGGYLISPAPNSGSDQQGSPFVEVYAPGTYHDAVVEVTVHMAPNGVPYGSAALALHASEGGAGSNLHFGINGDGSWGVLDDANCPPTPTGPDDSTCSYDSTDQASAIHHAAWAPNTLTAILRGNQVICFINGVFVGSAQDLGPQSGRLGFGVEGLGVPVVFSDFTIYPL